MGLASFTNLAWDARAAIPQFAAGSMIAANQETTATCPPEAQNGLMPDLVGYQVDLAEATLTACKEFWDRRHPRAVHVTLDPSTPPDGTDPQAVIIRAHDPTAGTDILAGAAPLPPLSVTLTLGAQVPDLQGESLESARNSVAERGLVVEAEPPGAELDWTVEAQDSPVGDLVPFRTEILVELRDPVVPTPGPTPTATPRQPPIADLVIVPDVIGMTAITARKATGRRGLVLALNPLGQGRRISRVISQDPLPGTRVTTGSTVLATVRLIAPPRPPRDPEEEPASFPLNLSALLLFLAGALVLGAVLHQALERRSWKASRLTSEPHPDTAPHIAVETPDGHAFRFEPHVTVGVVTTEEVLE